MPNIIEQQDLLKGLPDTRLMMLLQNPVADIPPFLVAAEAQRRQAIRQQFAGSESKESVVDILTKQLANVPQNISSAPRTPPMVPPSPPMEGVAALQTQQAVQQMAQPQMMRHGGVVQRYQAAGLVQPFRGRAGAGGYRPGEQPEGYGIISDILGDISDATTRFVERMKRLGLTPTPAQIEEVRKEEERKVSERRAPDFPPYANTNMPIVSTPPKEQVPVPPQTEMQPIPGETEDEFRSRLEALYAAQEPSDWEKAQKWFAMSEQFLDPSKTTMQSIAGAGRAFAESAAEQARAQRAMELAQQKAMLEYDIDERNRIAAAEAEKAKREYEFKQEMLKRGTPTADAALAGIDRNITQIEERIAELSDPMNPNQNPELVKALQKRKDALMLQREIIMRRGGFADSTIVTEEELRALGI